MNKLTFDNRKDAEEVLDRLHEIMDTYGTVSVADVNELTGKIGNYKDHGYGWTDINSTNIIVNGNEYILEIEDPKKFK